MTDGGDPMIRLALVSITLFAACGADDEAPPPTAVVSDPEAESLCDEYCAHADECNWPNANTCAADCDEWSSFFRADVFRFLHDCGMELHCDESMLSCWSEAEDSFVTTGAQQALSDHCETRLDECGTPDIFIDPVCHPQNLWAASDQAVAAIDACLDEPCDQIQACVDEARAGWDAPWI